MTLTRQRLEVAARLVGYNLLTPAPSYANGALALDEAIAGEEGRRRQRLVNIWLEIHEPVRTGFIWVGEGSGQYRRELPAGTDPNTVVVIQVDPSRRPALALLDQLTRLIATLSDKAEIYDSPTQEMLILTDPEVAQPQLRQLMPLLKQVRDACAPDYNTRTIESLTRSLREVHLPAIQAREWSAIEEHLRSIKTKGTDLRDYLAADCVLAAWLRLYPDVCDLVWNTVESENLDDTQARAQWVRYVGFGCAPVIPNAVDLTNGFAAKAAREGFGTPLAKLARAYFKQGGDHVETALSGTSLEAWANCLYRAGTEFYLANRTYEALAANVPNQQTDELQRYGSIAEEQATLVGNALLFAVKNRDGSRLARDRALVQQRR